MSEIVARLVNDQGNCLIEFGPREVPAGGTLEIEGVQFRVEGKLKGVHATWFVGKLVIQVDRGDHA